MRATELKDMPTSELLTKEKGLKGEVFNLKFKLATEQLTNTAKLRSAKRDLARVKTVLRERELGLVPDPEQGATAEGEEA